MKLLSIVGARPQFVKAAMIQRWKPHTLVHTGQHYDPTMSEIFIKELKLPGHVNLCVGQGSRITQLSKILRRLERFLLDEKPDHVLVYGDTTSTLAGAIACNTLQIPLSHIEAGQRSFDLTMPEERNRILTDHASQFLFCSTKEAMRNLLWEGLDKKTYLVGDVMIDAIRFYSTLPPPYPTPKYAYHILTLHRPENVDRPETLIPILEAFAKTQKSIIFPVHPRARAQMKKHGIPLSSNINAREPVGYFEMIHLLKNCVSVFTDSGGVQKEAAALGKKCYTLRKSTEWTETLHTGWNELIKPGQIPDCLERPCIPEEPFPTELHYGDGLAAHKIVDILCN